MTLPLTRQTRVSSPERTTDASASINACAPPVSTRPSANNPATRGADAGSVKATITSTWRVVALAAASMRRTLPAKSFCG